ncbi:hypothetical protein LOD99_6203 [Oopsacas minuta]|uniref:Uncharacterized protein n=1 Tax=Oopsacas minuta TaxID=111878 RepID=A0AAV7JMV3_9METZ|nr:hypothetical protein LOD99_6203 [Oopsacas minuta]
MNVGDHGVELRSKAIGMLEGGITQKEVAIRLNVGVRTVRRWWSQHKGGETMETKPRSGRPQILKLVSRIVIKKSLGKVGNQPENCRGDYLSEETPYLT